MRAPTKNSDGKTPSDSFMSACPHTRGAVYFWAWFNDKQARSTTTASTDKKYRLQNAVGYFYVGLPTNARRASLGGGNASQCRRILYIINIIEVRDHRRIFVPSRRRERKYAACVLARLGRG